MKRRRRSPSQLPLLNPLPEINETEQIIESFNIFRASNPIPQKATDDDYVQLEEKNVFGLVLSMLWMIKKGKPFTFRLPSLQPVYVEELRRFALKRSFNLRRYDDTFLTSRRLFGLLKLISKAYTLNTLVVQKAHLIDT